MASIVSRCLMVGILSASAALASSSNAPEFYLGMKGAVSCTACHKGAGVNAGGGAVKIEGIPAAYMPGEKYTVKVTIAHPGFKKWGFILSATGPNGQQAGRFVSNDPQIDLKVSSGVMFAKQSFNGTDSLGAARSWTLIWKAPAGGAVKFDAQGLAADGSGNVNGDYVYNASVTTVAGAATAD